MLARGTPPPRALKLSCIEFTAPVEVPVVAPAKIADQATPKRCSLPSMDPSGPPAAAYSAHAARPMLVTSRPAMVAVATAPWRRLRTISP